MTGPSLIKLMRANRHNDLVLAEYLLIEGHNANERDEMQWHSLHYAALHGRERAVQCLLYNGANVDPRNADYLQTPLHIASEKGNYAIVSLLLAGGADVHAVDREWNTPLQLAIENGHPRTAALLRRHGAEY